MLVADVNVFVYAHRPESPRHAEYVSWLSRALTGTEPFGVSELVLSAFLRIVTHHRVYVDPTPPEVGLQFCRAVLDAPAAIPVRSGPRHWRLFEALVPASGSRGNLIPDAYLAALAMEHGATFVTTDPGFARFAGLSWRAPLE